MKSLATRLSMSPQPSASFESELFNRCMRAFVALQSRQHCPSHATLQLEHLFVIAIVQEEARDNHEEARDNHEEARDNRERGSG